MKFAICHVRKFGQNPHAPLAAMRVVYGNAEDGIAARPFEFVGVVEAEDLEGAYEASQNGVPGGPVSWCPDYHEGKYGARSTSVYDVIIDETGALFSVDMVGFTEHAYSAGLKAMAAQRIANAPITKPRMEG